MPIDSLRDEVKTRGFLDVKETGGLTVGARPRLFKAKTDLYTSGRYIEKDGLFWKLAAREFVLANNKGKFHSE